MYMCTCFGVITHMSNDVTFFVCRQVYDGDNLIIPFTFYVQNKTKAIELHCNTQEDKNVWMSVSAAARRLSVCALLSNTVMSVCVCLCALIKHMFTG